MKNCVSERCLPKAFDLVFLVLAFVIVALNAHAAPNRPNVLLIIADDLGIQLPAYGDHTIATPNLDSLAANGVVFRNGYTAQSSCSPSRSTIHTGTYPHQNGHIGLQGFFKMRQAYPTISSILHDAGYRTGVIGKTNVSPPTAFKWDFGALQNGWDDWYQTRDVARVAAHAKSFFAQAGGTPFFLQVGYIDPHGPLVAQDHGLPAQLVDPDSITRNTWTGQPVPAEKGAAVATYYNCLARLDAGIGMLLRELAAAGAAGNTLVIFVSDNGAGPVQGGKTDIFESGLRVPFMVRYPGVGQQGVVRTQLVSTVDILPTILDAANIPVPEPTRTMMTEGRSLLPLLNASQAPWRKYLFAEMNFHYPEDNKPSRSVRDNRYKLIHSYPPLVRGINGWMLFDLQKDPLEKKNLFASTSPAIGSVRDTLVTELRAWQTRTSDTLPH